MGRTGQGEGNSTRSGDSRWFEGCTEEERERNGNIRGTLTLTLENLGLDILPNTHISGERDIFLITNEDSKKLKA